MESVKTIRAVERAFEVMRALQERINGATLAELQAATGLSGPTTLRILKTLIGVKAVRRGMFDRRYRNCIQLEALTRGMHPIDRLADVAAPWLDMLCRQVEWPSDLAVHSGNDDFMSVLESNLLNSRFFVRRTREGVCVNLLASAAGTAFLAALVPQRRGELVQSARKGRDVHNHKVIALNDIERRVEQARERGYAARHKLYMGGGYNGKPRDDSLNAIAVPVISGDKLLGALNINWNRAAMTEKEMVRRNLPRLNAAAEGIAGDAATQGILDDLLHTEDTQASPDGFLAVMPPRGPEAPSCGDIVRYLST